MRDDEPKRAKRVDRGAPSSGFPKKYIYLSIAIAIGGVMAVVAVAGGIYLIYKVKKAEPSIYSRYATATPEQIKQWSDDWNTGQPKRPLAGKTLLVPARFSSVEGENISAFNIAIVTENGRKHTLWAAREVPRPDMKFGDMIMVAIEFTSTGLDKALEFAKLD